MVFTELELSSACEILEGITEELYDMQEKRGKKKGRISCSGKRITPKHC